MAKTFLYLETELEGASGLAVTVSRMPDRTYLIRGRRGFEVMATARHRFIPIARMHFLEAIDRLQKAGMLTK